MGATPTAYLESLPDWARRLSQAYYSRSFSTFVLHGNVRDLVGMSRGAQAEFVPLHRFLKEALFGQRDLVLVYDRGGGLSFGDADMQADFQRALSGYDAYHGTNFCK